MAAHRSQDGSWLLARQTAVAYSPSWLMLIKASWSPSSPEMMATGAPSRLEWVEACFVMVMSCQVSALLG